jgi:hypothetical protein
MNIKYNFFDSTVISIITGVFLFLSFPLLTQLESYSQNESSKNSPPISIKTDNGALGISVNWDSNLTLGNEIPFSFAFKHPFDDTNLQHVNYDLHLFDKDGKPVYSKEGLHTHTGTDVQDIMIENSDSYTMLITVVGTGIDPPFDTTRSGIAQIQLEI